ncbi:hypothetical protein NSA23_15570 [Anaerosalibacter massiliensis]|uniref:Uncharacterized protein n=1 Tax=Anaerosalibacter massiliensis TaxID=1347392 RepID=A0A9X2MM14_9FIRM|nr:hypothetical protein [Anaerosalibacter massiliensis]MCR2045520.1 hypothetical protein [Anaerosalibacter massiliensis]
MADITYKNSAKDLTVESAEYFNEKLHIAVAVNDGKHLTLSTEKEPTAAKLNRF